MEIGFKEFGYLTLVVFMFVFVYFFGKVVEEDLEKGKKELDVPSESCPKEKEEKP